LSQEIAKTVLSKTKSRQKRKAKTQRYSGPRRNYTLLEAHETEIKVGVIFARHFEATNRK
jgi:hypothetical protein